MPGDHGTRHSVTTAKRRCQRLLEGVPLSEHRFIAGED